MYEARKHSHGGDRKSDDFSSSQSGNMIARVSEQVAGEQNVAKNTVIRAEKFAKGLDAIREASPETADAILRGESKVSKHDVAMVAKAEPEERGRMVEQIKAGEKVTPVAVPDKITHRAGENIFPNWRDFWMQTVTSHRLPARTGPPLHLPRKRHISPAPSRPCRPDMCGKA